MQLSEKEIENILTGLLYEFPIKELKIDFAPWVSKLEKGNSLKAEIFNAVFDNAKKLKKVRDANQFLSSMTTLESIGDGKIANVDLACGSVKISLIVKPELFYKTLSEKCGIDIKDDLELFSNMLELAKMKSEYTRFKQALDEVERTVYGIVMPTMQELKLEEPEIVRQGGRYGVRLQASAPSIHMMKANITTQVAPIVGSESQSEELIMYLLKEF